MVLPFDRERQAVETGVVPLAFAVDKVLDFAPEADDEPATHEHREVAAAGMVGGRERFTRALPRHADRLRDFLSRHRTAVPHRVENLNVAWREIFRPSVVARVVTECLYAHLRQRRYAGLAKLLF